jgi:hypothetical protein
MSNDNDLEYAKVEVLWTNPDENGDREWLIDVHFTDGSSCIMDDRRSHAEALVVAHTYGVPVLDQNPTLVVD